MGSLFSGPTIPTYSPVQYVAPKASPQTIVREGEAQSPVTEGISDDSQIKDVIKRTTRGRNSLVQTSYRGVLGNGNPLVPQRKSLLGE